MPRRRDVPDAELAVLRVLWKQGPATVREITDRLYPGGSTSHYATVQKLLHRLMERRFVRRNTEGRAHVFTAEVGREELIRRRLRDAADKLCEGSLTPLLTQLVNARDWDAGEIRELRALVERLDREAEGKR